MRMAKDPAVSSVECDCYIRADMSLPESDGSSPGTHDQVKAVGMYQVEAVARRLSVHEGAPWGLDRIDTNGRPTDGKYDDGDLTGKGVRVHCTSWTRAYRARTSTSEAAWSTGTR